MKNKIILFTIVVIFISITITTIVLLTYGCKNKNVKVVSYSTDIYNELPIYYYSALYSYDTTTPEKLIGATDYTFICKINGIVRTEYRNSLKTKIIEEGLEKEVELTDPYTIYSVTVIENIKGNLIKTKDIEVEQLGGILEDRNGYMFPEGTGLLNVGEYYILSPYSPFEKGNLQINCSTSIIALGKIDNPDILNESKNIVINKNEIESVKKNILEKESIDTKVMETVLEYAEASINPIIPEDKKSGNINKSIYDIFYNE